jgi:hypothetical protein
MALNDERARREEAVAELALSVAAPERLSFSSGEGAPGMAAAYSCTT